MKKLFVLLSLLFLWFPNVSHAALTTSINNYWKLDESSGNAADSVGGSTLTNTNTITYSAGIINNGANFSSASSQYFTTADTAALSVTGDTTWSFWLKPSSPFGSTVDPVLIAKFLTSGQFSYYIQYNSSTNTLFLVNSADGTNTGFASVATSALSAGTWYHFCVVYTAATPLLQVYLNGTSQGTNTNTLKTSIHDGTDPLQIGRYPAGASNYLNGELDEIGIWSRALSGTECSQLYNSGAGLQYPFATASTPTSILGLVRAFFLL